MIGDSWKSVYSRLMEERLLQKQAHRGAQDEAVKSLKNAATITTIVCLAWFASLAEVRIRLDQYDAARHLIPWLIYRGQEYAQIGKPQFIASTRLVTHGVDGADTVVTILQETRVVVSIPWPETKTDTLTLNTVQIISTQADSLPTNIEWLTKQSPQDTTYKWQPWPVPLSDYASISVGYGHDRPTKVVNLADAENKNYLVMLLQTVATLPQGHLALQSLGLSDWKITGLWSPDSPLYGSPTPLGWRKLAPLFGFTSISPDTLSLGHPAVGNVLQKVYLYTGGEADFFGARVPLVIFFSLVGVLLATVSFFLMEGPLAVLGKTSLPDYPWVFSVPLGGLRKVIAGLVSVGWVLLPLIMLFYQWRTVDYRLLNRTLLIMSSLGLIYSFCTFFRVGVRLAGVRAAQRSDKSGSFLDS